MNKITAFFSALYHDVGKATTTKWNEKKQDFQAINHENESAIIAHDALKNFVPNEYINSIITLIQNHMINESISDKKLRKLADDICGQSKGNVTLFDLIQIRKADGRGRICDNNSEEATNELEKRMFRLNVLYGPLSQLITGKDMIQIGFKQGKIIGQIISEIRQKQYADEIKTVEEAINFAQRRFNNISKEIV